MAVEIPTTPAQTHWVWLGSSFENEEFERYVSKTCSVLDGFKKFMWTDQTAISERMSKFCHERQIQIISVDKAFANTEKMPFEKRELYDKERTKEIPNYGAASDILRYNILKVFGGVYCDIDVDLVGFSSSTLVREQLLKKLTTGQFYYHEEERNMCNDLLISPPGHPLLRKLFTEMGSRYEKSDEEIETIRKRISHTLPEIFQTTYRTGPGLLRDMVERHPEGTQAYDWGLLYKMGDPSWLPKKAAT